MVELDLSFQKIYQQFQPMICRYLTELVGAFEAEDLTQEVFTKISRSLTNFQGKSKLSTWIYRIATNTAIDRLRSPSYNRMVQRKPLQESGNSSEAIIEAGEALTTEKEPSPDEIVIQKEMNQCIRSFIENLPENYKAVVILSELEGLKNQEIADILQ